MRKKLHVDILFFFVIRSIVNKNAPLYVSFIGGARVVLEGGARRQPTRLGLPTRASSRE